MTRTKASWQVTSYRLSISTDIKRQDLTAVALEEMLFPSSKTALDATSAAYEVQDRARILMSVAATMHEKPSPLELVIEKVRAAAV